MKATTRTTAKHDEGHLAGPENLDTSNPVLNCIANALKALRGPESEDVTIMLAYKVGDDPFDWQFEGSVPVLYEMLERVKHLVNLVVDTEEGIGTLDG